MRKLQSLTYALAIIANAILVLSWTPILFAVFRERPVADAAIGTVLLCLIPISAVLALVSLVWKLRP